MWLCGLFVAVCDGVCCCASLCDVVMCPLCGVVCVVLCCWMLLLCCRIVVVVLLLLCVDLCYCPLVCVGV